MKLNFNMKINEYLKEVRELKGNKLFLQETKIIYLKLKILLEKSNSWKNANLEEIKKQSEQLDKTMQEIEIKVAEIPFN